MIRPYIVSLLSILALCLASCGSNDLTSGVATSTESLLSRVQFGFGFKVEDGKVWFGVGVDRIVEGEAAPGELRTAAEVAEVNARQREINDMIANRPSK